MTERPILFSAPMVRAILTGQKTVTRRVVTVPGADRSRLLPCEPHFVVSDDRLKFMDEYGDYHDFAKKLACPYGEPGDRLWVRETWGLCSWLGDDSEAEIIYDADQERRWCKVTEWSDHEFDQWIDREGGRLTPGEVRPKRPSIFLPRWASRIDLEVVTVDVERLHAITESGMAAEGVATADELTQAGRVERWAALWNGINGKPGRRWEDNPWVWAIGFKRIEATAK